MELLRREVIKGRCRKCGAVVVYVRRDLSRRLVCRQCRGKVIAKGHFVDYVA